MSQSSEILVAVNNSERLLVEPIWERPIDKIEGKLYQKYIQKNPRYNQVFVRQTVEKRLNTASSNLPKNYKLILRAGHRPMQVQLDLFKMLKLQYLNDNPNSSDLQAVEYARTFVSDPTVKLPPHCCGSAIDVDVLNIATNSLVDFGCPMNTDNEIAFSDSTLISSRQSANRKMLNKAMINAGFAPFKYEWWHFSYGDQVWADFYHQQVLYGLIEPQF